MPGSVDQLTNRLLWLAGLLGVLLIAVVVNSLLHGDEGGLNPIAQAAERTGHLAGGKLAMEVTYSAPSLATPVTGHGSGSFNARSGRSQVELSIQAPGGATETITSVGDERTVFIRSPKISAGLPNGRTWLGVQPLLGHDPQTAFSSGGGAKSTIEMLAAVGDDVHRVDQQDVRGHPTTRYQGSIDLSRVSEILAEHGEAELAQEYEALASEMPDSIPVEVWIDRQGLARRIDMVEELPVTDEVTVTTEMKMEFFDLGAEPKIDLPSADEVFDATPALRAELGIEEGA